MKVDLPASAGEFPHFAAARSRDRRRIEVGSRALIGVGGHLLRLIAAASPHRGVRAATRAWAAAAVRLLRLDIHVHGLEHIDEKERYLVLSLHEGLADALALLRLPLDLRFAARDELFAWPHLGGYLRATHQIRVEEAASRTSLRALYEDVGHAFAVGDSVVLFPQGTVLGIEIAFRPGASRIARRFQRPVLPVVLTGGHRVVEHPFSPLVRLDQEMTMHVLPPIEGSDFTPATARIVERRMKALALTSTTPPRRYVPQRDGWWDDYRFEIDSDFGELARLLAAHRSSSAG